MLEWESLENWIVEKFKKYDPFVKRSPGSGNKSVKGDLKFSSNSCGLHIEAKQRNKISVYDENWLEKCASEIPLHMANSKIPIIFTMNKDHKIRVHLDADDFMKIFDGYFEQKNGSK
jgi:hypothetical protein